MVDWGQAYDVVATALKRCVLIAGSVAVAAGTAGCGSATSTHAAGVPGQSEVAAAPVSTAGKNPFMPTVGRDTPGIKPPAAAQSASGGIARYSGSLPGLSGGTRTSRSCDAAKLVSFLGENPS